MQSDTVDEPDNDCLGKALCATMQISLACTCPSTETYEVHNVHMGICTGAVDHVTLANCWKVFLERAKNTVEWMM